MQRFAGFSRGSRLNPWPKRGASLHFSPPDGGSRVAAGMPVDRHRRVAPGNCTPRLPCRQHLSAVFGVDGNRAHGEFFGREGLT